jgi:DNA-binding NarL/FixJ family response regulator
VGEALELATQHKPHVAVVAVSLPLLKGLEVNRGIRRGSPLTQVLALSSQEREDLISMALAAGAQSWLTKTAVTSLLESVARDRKEPHVLRRGAQHLARDAHC